MWPLSLPELDRQHDDLTGVSSFGYTSKQTALLSIPSGAVSIVSVLAATFLAGHFDQRAIFICVFLLLTMLGGALMAFLPNNAQAGKLVKRNRLFPLCDHGQGAHVVGRSEIILPTASVATYRFFTHGSLRTLRATRRRFVSTPSY